jgi:hypothetical protein
MGVGVRVVARDAASGVFIGSTGTGVPWSFETGGEAVDPLPLNEGRRFWIGVGGGSDLVGCSMSGGCSDSVRAARDLRSLMYRCIVGKRSLL